MRKALAMEFQKTRRRKVWVIVSLLLVVQLLWSFWGIGRMDAHERTQGWMFFFYQFPLLNSIMMPVIAAVVASRLGDIEHKGNTLKLLSTVMPTGQLFDAKFLCGAFYLSSTVLLQVIAMIAVGCAAGFEGAPPALKLGYYLLFTTSVSLTIFLLQQALSLLIQNQMIPLAVGILGSFAGLFIMFFPEHLERFILWGYYGVLMFVRMNWDTTTRITEFYYLPADWIGFLTLIVLFGIIYLIGRTLFIRKEM
ncbi:MAG: hypothetical protein K0S60_309 [Evtepia sp.]|jgi:hypothetical protein|nr:hypothetical protein [Evtepia sp.]